MTAVFLHGLDSSSKGTKAAWFRAHFPQMLIPDFSGTLADRVQSMDELLAGKEDLLLVGSSFGGLMATIYALENGNRVRQVILLAPALNFQDFMHYLGRKTKVPARLYIGAEDKVCPPHIVIPAARRTFVNITIHVTEDDHLLRSTFPVIDWQQLLSV